MIRRTFGLPILLSLMLAALGAGPALAGTGEPRGAAPEAQGGAAADFTINLADESDFVSQYTPYWCIGASMQMMLKIVGVADDDSRAAQEQYMRVARAEGASPQDVDPNESAGGLRGAGSGGWARGLTQLGAGRYEERAIDGYDEAVRASALALRTTRRPVGLIVWRGAHAWVMTGFTATADPAVDPDFEVTGVYIHDSWYPRISSIWGPGQEPNSWISIDALKEDFLARRGGRWHAELAGKFVVVMPVAIVRPAMNGLRLL